MTGNKIYKVGLGGGCHWCTEAVFASLKGVEKVDQGWIASLPPQDIFSEAVIVTYNPEIITLKDLIEVHIHTHAATSNHSMRHKYRSAIYCFTETGEAAAKYILEELQPSFTQPLITCVLPYADFKQSLPAHLDYYYSNPEKPFCRLYINPKLQLLRDKFADITNANK